MHRGKPWYESKTIWGSLVSASAAISALTAILPNAQSYPDFAQAIVQLLGATGALLAIHGRFCARQAIL